jgi:signal peptidase II
MTEEANLVSSNPTPEAAAPPPEGSTTGETPKPAGPLPGASTPWKPSVVHLAVVSIVALALDLGTKQWAKTQLPECQFSLGVHRHLEFCLARNPGGAFGLLQDEPETIRRPFFLGISVLAVAFIVSLYRKLTPQQWALKWGLPLVLGGALGNLIDRIQDRHVIDFIDYRAEWIRSAYSLVSRHPTDHWPTFNIADIAIVAGVALMAIDMFTPRKASPEGASVPPDVASSTAPVVGPPGGAAPAATPEPPITGSDAPKPPVGGDPEPAAKET